MPSGPRDDGCHQQENIGNKPGIGCPHRGQENVPGRCDLAPLDLDERRIEDHENHQRALRGEWVKPEDAPFVTPVLRWLSERFPEAMWEMEKGFSCHLGYGGKTDAVTRKDLGAVVDFKTKSFTDAGSIEGYPEQGMQLAAYRHGVKLPQATCLNLFISTDIPGLIVPIEWREEDLQTGMEAFKCLLRLWQLRKKFNPSWEE